MQRQGDIHIFFLIFNVSSSHWHWPWLLPHFHESHREWRFRSHNDFSSFLLYIKLIGCGRRKLFISIAIQSNPLYFLFRSRKKKFWHFAERQWQHYRRFASLRKWNLPHNIFFSITFPRRCTVESNNNKKWKFVAFSKQQKSGESIICFRSRARCMQRRKLSSEHHKKTQLFSFLSPPLRFGLCILLLSVAVFNVENCTSSSYWHESSLKLSTIRNNRNMIRFLFISHFGLGWFERFANFPWVIRSHHHVVF